MPHIHTQPGQHDHTVSAYILRYDGDTPYLLLHRHKKYRSLMQPGGHVELDENPWQSVLHEMSEETGYDPRQLELLQPYAPIFTTAHNTVVMPLPFLTNSHQVHDGTIDEHYHDDSVYVFVTHELPVGKPDEDESDELYWLSPADIEGWDEADMAPAVKDIALTLFEYCLGQWVPVAVDAFSTQNP